MDQFFHSVMLDSDLCKGCINCIKRCPTEAIRVRGGKAKIITERCIDCGECIRICPHHAKKAIYDKLSVLDDYRYTIALPAPSLYGQFNNLEDVDIVLNALLKMGFDQVFEVAKAAEIVSDISRRVMSEGRIEKPVISSACPTVVRLIRVRFPELIDHVLPLNAPIDVAAKLARKQALEEHPQLKPEDIGVIFISPCPAKVTAVKMPLVAEKSDVDAVVAISDVYPKLISYMEDVDQNPEEMEELSSAGKIGVSWASSGGEAAALLGDNYLAADGIENVIKVLEDLEDDKFPELDFVELNACAGGCVGGVLTVENPYVAKARLKKLRKYLPVAMNHVEKMIPEVQWDKELEYASVLSLDDNLEAALHKMNELERIAGDLPGLDCGSCGAPSCRALAEDVVRGVAKESDCIMRLRRQMEELAQQEEQQSGPGAD